MQEYHEFPKWKHHPEHPSVIVQDAEEEASLGEGWTNFKGEEPEKSEPTDELAALRQIADENGIKYDKRWGAERLKKEIEAATTEDEQPQ